MSFEKQTRNIKTRRVSIAEVGVSPSTRPLYANHVVTHGLGGEVFLDFSIVPIEDALIAQQGGDPARLVLLERVVLSMETYRQLVEQGTDFLGRLGEPGATETVDVETHVALPKLENSHG